MVEKERYRRALICLLCAICLSASYAADAPRFLIFHLDAVASLELDRALAEGRLPNLEAAFAGGGRLDALTLYPAGTEILYPRLKMGVRNDGPGPIGWGWYDREQERAVGNIETFLEMLSYMPRRAKSNLLYGVPYLDMLAGAAMLNVPELLERYGVVEFFWFATDSWGHWQGREAFVRSLEGFDAYLGQLLPRLDLSRLNLIVYSDHGMTFSDETVDLERLVAEHIGEGLLYYVYPNIYLHDPGHKAALARRLALESEVDFVFYRQDARRVEGYLHRQFVVFEAAQDGIRYLAETDPLGYAALGYAGEALAAEAWLELTARSYFPAVPPNVFYYLQNPNVGDLVLGLNPPKIPLTEAANQANHAGLIHTDMVVPILLRGPELEPFYELELLWLHTLYEAIPVLEFSVLPAREEHRLELWLDLSSGAPLPSGQLLLSPAYRWRVGLEGRPDRLALWGEYDLYSSYLTRWWLGAGAAYREQMLSPMLVGQVEFDVAELGLALRGSASRHGLELGLKLNIQVIDGARFTWHVPAGLGASFSW